MTLRVGRCRLPILLRKADMTQNELARRIGVSESMISKYIAGEKVMSLVRAKHISDIVGCSIEDLYEWHITSDSKR